MNFGKHKKFNIGVDNASAAAAFSLFTNDKMWEASVDVVAFIVKLFSIEVLTVSRPIVISDLACVPIEVAPVTAPTFKYVGIYSNSLYFILRILSHILNLFTYIYGFLCNFIKLPLYKYFLQVFNKCSFHKRSYIIFDQLNPSYAKYFTKTELENVREYNFSRLLNLIYKYQITLPKDVKLN